MFIVHAVQAQFGDCLVLEYGAPGASRFMLIDGGPSDNYDPYLKDALQKIVVPKGGAIERMVLSHVDTDHTNGLLDMLAELRASRDALEDEFVTIGGFWHNSFASTLDPQGAMAPRIAQLQTLNAVASMDHAGAAILGVKEGAALRRESLFLEIPLNQDFQDPIVVETCPDPAMFGNLNVTIVGPTQANLDELKAKWEDWLEANEQAIATASPRVLANLDKSIPNLSSICFVAEADGKRGLFTGDARSDHTLQGLEAQGFLDAAGKVHFDLIKLAHHGSNRNVTRKFFDRVTADIYVVSADGKDDNPDLATLIWLVESAKDQNREIRIVATNQTESTDKIVEEYPPDDYGYTLEFRPNEDNYVSVVLSA